MRALVPAVALTIGFEAVGAYWADLPCSASDCSADHRRHDPHVEQQAGVDVAANRPHHVRAVVATANVPFR